MRLLSFDLVWDGLTGWVLWDDDQSDPIVSYGEFKPKAPSKLKGIERQQALCASLYYEIGLVVDTVNKRDLDAIVFERSDWHQNLNGQEWKQIYARERVVQRSLGMAEATMMMVAFQASVPLQAIGAAEAKREFGAIRKDSAARLICDEYPRFSIIDVKEDSYGKDYLFGKKGDGFFVVKDHITAALVPHHVTDAIVIAKVMASRMRKNELAN